MSKEIIGVVGSGAMGSGIAQVAATAGHVVYVYDSNQASIQKAQQHIEVSLNKLVEKGKISGDTQRDITNNLRFVSQIEAFQPCDLIIEAIIEDLAVKQTLFSQIEAIVKPSCMLASNTSSLSIASIASACQQPERFLGIHFFNPATLMPLVEIIPGIASDRAVVEKAYALVKSWGKETVMVKDTPGFIVNRVARSYYGESIRIYEEGIADMATIDWALKKFGGFKMGPFELMDFIGNDINYKVTETVWEQFFYEPRFKPSLTQKRLYESKRFGRKSGVGYYNYAADAVQPMPKEDETIGKLIVERVLAMLINEAADALYLQVASKEDLDLAMMKGVNYPKGLLAWCDELGVSSVYQTLRNLYETYEEDRYRPCVQLKKMAEKNERFY